MRQYEIRMQGQVAELSIIGDIDWWNSNNSADFTRQLNELRAAGATELRGYINSAGGDMFQANEIHNLILAFPGRKTCRLGALIASAATTIACAFTDGIEMAENGQYMIHNPVLRVEGGDKEIRTALQLYANVREGAINIYTTRTGLSAAEIGTMMDAETWMNATTAKTKGFVTAISGQVAELPTDTAEVLNKYHYAGVPAVLNQALATPSLRPAPAPAAQLVPTNRAGWKLNDWHAHDPQGLATMHTANPSLFAQLYQQHYGTPYQSSSREPRARQVVPNAAPVPVAEPPAPAALTEPAKRSLLAQLPNLGPLLTAMLDQVGQTIAALPGDRITANPQDFLRRERVLTEGIEQAISLVSGTETAVYLLGALGPLGVLAENPNANPARLAADRTGRADTAMWAVYKNRMQSIARCLQKAEVAAAEPTAALYEILPAPKGREKWTLQDWMDKDPEGLQTLREENPNLFRQLYQAKYGIDPET